MEGVAPPLELLLVVKRSLEKGQPTKEGVHLYLKRNQGEFALQVGQWFSLLQQGKDTQFLVSSLNSQHRKTLLAVLERGLRGESIYEMLSLLEGEIIEACHDEITNKLARMPLVLLIPLLLFQFPAFLLLLFGPLLQNFFHSLGGG